MKKIKNMFGKYVLFLAFIALINSQSSLATSSTMTIRLKSNGLLYANPGIIIDFLINPLVVRTQD